MSVLDTDHTAIEEAHFLEDFSAPEGWQPLRVYADSHCLSEAGLAVLAMGQPYWALEHEGRYVLCVKALQSELVERELDRMEQLRKTTKQSPTAWHFWGTESVGWQCLLQYALLLVLTQVLATRFGWAESGRVDARLMLEGHEWWRAVTALTLHGDSVHLASNLVGGMGFGYLVCRIYGAGLGWLLILLSGCIGNAINAWVYYPSVHYSIGASTAVFGALGLLTGSAVVRLRGAGASGSSWLPQWCVALFAGLTLLSLLGLGDERVDVGAHFCGFFVGLLCGLIRFFQRQELRRMTWVWGCAFSVWTLLSLSWWFALR